MMGEDAILSASVQTNGKVTKIDAGMVPFRFSNNGKTMFLSGRGKPDLHLGLPPNTILETVTGAEEIANRRRKIASIEEPVMLEVYLIAVVHVHHQTDETVCVDSERPTLSADDKLHEVGKQAVRIVDIPIALIVLQLVVEPLQKLSTEQFLQRQLEDTFPKHNLGSLLGSQSFPTGHYVEMLNWLPESDWAASDRRAKDMGGFASIVPDQTSQFHIDRAKAGLLWM